MPLTVVETDSFPSSLQVPAAGELASAPALVSQFLQGIANSRRWLYNRVNKLVVGGAFTPSDNLAIDTPSTKTLSLNGAVIDSAADGGDLRPLGAVKGMHCVVAASGTSGTVAIPYYAEHVYASGFGYPVGGGCVWQVGTPPSGDSTRRWVMKLVNFQSTAIVVKDAGGSTLATIAQDTNAIRAVTIAFDGSSWVVIDYQWYHS